MSDKVFVLIIYFICRFVVFASMSAITVKNRKRGQKFETFTHKQTICDTFWDKEAMGMSHVLDFKELAFYLTQFI